MLKIYILSPGLTLWKHKSTVSVLRRSAHKKMPPNEKILPTDRQCE